MSEITSPTEHSNTAPVASFALPTRKPSLVKAGGALGIAATLLALAVFLVACFGFDAVFMLSPLVLLLAGIGFVLGIVGTILNPPGGDQETQPIAGMFVSIIGIVAGLMELWIASSLWHS